MGEQDVLAEALIVAAHQAIHRGAREFAADLFKLVGDGKRHQPCACGQQGVAELFGYLITKAGSPQRRNRQPAGGDHQRLAVNWPQSGIEAVAVVGLFDLLDRGVQVQAHARFVALIEEHFEDVAGFVIAEQLAEFLLVVGHAVLAHQFDEIPLGVAGQGRLAEVRVLREEIVGFGVHVGEVAAATARHQDLFTCLVGVVDQHDLAPTAGSGQRAHQTCGASANNHNVGRAQSGVLTKKCRV